eukprot:3752467-Amphidinium_carterae.2
MFCFWWSVVVSKIERSMVCSWKVNFDDQCAKLQAPHLIPHSKQVRSFLNTLAEKAGSALAPAFNPGHRMACNRQDAQMVMASDFCPGTLIQSSFN